MIRKLLLSNVLLFSVAVGLPMSQCTAEENVRPRVIELPMENGQYDIGSFALLINREDHANGSDGERATWYPLTARTRLALSLLKTEGAIIDYMITPSCLRIEFNENRFRDVKTLLFPPHFLNINEFVGQKRVVVLVHGLEGGAITYCELAPAFLQHDWFPLQFAYPNDGDIEVPAQFLRNELSRLHRQNPDTRFVVVAHSLGGLLAWKALTTEGGSLKVTDLVTLGTPFAGSSMARFQAELEFSDVTMRLLSGDFQSLDIKSDGSGEAVAVLEPKSEKRRLLLSHPLPKDVRLHLVAGRQGPIEPSEQKRFADLIERFIKRLEPSETFESNLRDLANASELISGSGDGAVTVASATARDAQTRKVFDRTHTGLLKVGGSHDDLLQYILKILEE